MFILQWNMVVLLLVVLVSYILKMEPIQNQGLRICQVAFTTSPMQSLYVEENEPPLYLKFDKLCIQYALKPRSNPDNPVYDVVLTSSCMVFMIRNLLPSDLWGICPSIYLFGVLRRFQHCTGHITTGSWKGRGNQYIEFVRVLYCKLLTSYQLSHLRPWRGSNPGLRGGRRECYHSAICPSKETCWWFSFSKSICSVEKVFILTIGLLLY